MHKEFPKEYYKHVYAKKLCNCHPCKLGIKYIESKAIQTSGCKHAHPNHCPHLLPNTTLHIHRQQVYYTIAVHSSEVCFASSRVGASTIHRGLRPRPDDPGVVIVGSCNRSITGKRNPSVFPEPVRACATTSLPAATGRYDSSWMGNRVVIFLFRRAVCVDACNSSNVKGDFKSTVAEVADEPFSCTAWLEVDICIRCTAQKRDMSSSDLHWSV